MFFSFVNDHYYCGLWYANVGYIMNIHKYIIACEEEMTSHSLYNFIVKIMFLVLDKRYKLHVRSNAVNLHLIAEEDYERYVDQKV